MDAEWAALRARLGAAGAGPLSSVDGGEWASPSGFRPPTPGGPAASADDTWDWLDDATGFTPLPGGSSPPLDSGSIGASPTFPPPPADAHFLAPMTPLAPAATAAAAWAAAPTVYVILFGVGRADTEGIYSLRAARADNGLPHDTIVAFASEDDASRYAGLLEAAMDGHAPAVCPIDPGELLDFCADAGYAARLEPTGSLLLPPECNVGLTDWERSVRLRAGGWSVLDDEPVLSEGGSDSDSDTPLPLRPSPFLPPRVTNNAGAYTGPGGTVDLDEVRASLEWLLAGPDAAREAESDESENEA